MSIADFEKKVGNILLGANAYARKDTALALVDLLRAAQGANKSGLNAMTGLIKSKMAWTYGVDIEGGAE